MNLEEAKTLVENDIKVKLNTYLSCIDDFLTIKANLKQMAMEHLKQQSVPLAAKWKIAVSLNMVDEADIVNGILFTAGEMVNEDDLKQEVIDNLIGE